MSVTDQLSGCVARSSLETTHSAGSMQNRKKIFGKMMIPIPFGKKFHREKGLRSIQILSKDGIFKGPSLVCLLEESAIWDMSK